MSFAINRAHFAANWRLYRCLLWLSVRGIGVRRSQIRDGRCLVETDRPVPDAVVESLDGDPFTRTTLNGCQVIWQQSQQKEVTP